MYGNKENQFTFYFQFDILAKVRKKIIGKLYENIGHKAKNLTALNKVNKIVWLHRNGELWN